jgi:hypothetical protein
VFESAKLEGSLTLNTYENLNGKVFYYDPSGNQISDPSSASFSIAFGGDSSN